MEKGGKKAQEAIQFYDRLFSTTGMGKLDLV